MAGDLGIEQRGAGEGAFVVESRGPSRVVIDAKRSRPLVAAPAEMGYAAGFEAAIAYINSQLPHGFG